ncbi:MAG: ABC transporter substrate-binding protein [Gammaproteobacteria bacterium]|nr:ABC transporter substrate-binding protein [Gammaproteobacteria bacterium]
MLNRLHLTGMQLTRFWLLVFATTLLIAPLQAEPTPPDTVLEMASRQMVTAINTNQEKIKANPSMVNDLVEDILMPHIDFITSSKWVLGKHWRRANKEQKLEFIRQFRSLLLRFYSTALAEYLTNNTVSEDMFVFLPLRGDTSNKRVTVHSEIHAPSGSIIPVKYNMHLTKKGWKVYDVSIEGVSMVTTYRTSFASEIKQKGLDGLIASLAERNDKLARKDS